jgi:adenosylcobyric acid synthase
MAEYILDVKMIDGRSLKGGLLVAGTGSSVGKSVIVAGICRMLARQGVKVAPFKAQNMAINSYVTAQGAEIGRAQAMQAAAARIEPQAAMNPVLVKPLSDTESHVLVMGKPNGRFEASQYHDERPQLREKVLAALAALRDQFDVVICEGAGSPAEINLRQKEWVNMGLAEAGELPVVLVSDIDHGGTLASLYGTVNLLSQSDRELVKGFLINKFRGEPGLLRSGLDMLQDLTGLPTLGVLPWQGGLWLDAEDTIALDAQRDGYLPPLGKDGLDVVVVQLHWAGNITDVDPLAAEPGVSVRFSRRAIDIERADLVVLPGTRATIADLELIYSDGLVEALTERARQGDPILGFCGGYQILGCGIEDGIENKRQQASGLGLLPVDTVFKAEKTLTRTTGCAPNFADAQVNAYEIRHGVPRRHGAEPLFITEQGEEGCWAGSVIGTSLHGALECDDFRRGILRWVADARNRDWQPGTSGFAEIRERYLDQLGDLIADNVDTAALISIIKGDGNAAA